MSAQEFVEREYQGVIQGEEYVKALVLAMIADRLENIHNRLAELVSIQEHS